MGDCVSDAVKDNLDLDAESDRFARFKLISWWDQAKLADAKVLLVGVGAIGNEILKNLALLGVGRVFVIDLDVIEESNLSRSVLFRPEDRNLPKAHVAARFARGIYHEMKVQSLHGDAIYDLGLGLFRWADIVLCGLDNREARVAINQNVARAGKVWIDGAIERLDGVARLFDPATGPCYECTMNETDWKMLEARRSCALLSREEMQMGKVPTTPTTASVIAGIQTQEMLKYLHGIDTLDGQGFIFDGLHHESYRVTYTRKPDCPAHDVQEPVESLDWQVDRTTLRQMLDRARHDMGPRAVIEFNQELLASLTCPRCEADQELFTSLGKVSEARGRCPKCGEMRLPKMFHSVDGSETFLDRTLGDIGIPPWDVITGRVGEAARYYEFAGDRRRVLGEMA